MATIKADKRIERMVQAAHDAGMPRDQIEAFITAGYFPFPWWMRFHADAREADRMNGPEELALGGRRGPGKSHAVFAQVALDDCQRHPGLKVLYLRKVMKATTEGFEDMVEKILSATPHAYHQGRVDFPNGSRILIGGYFNESEIDKYLGLEYHAVIVEEATQLSLIKIMKIYGSVRSAMTDWRPRKYLTTNPDGIGLSWFKERFVKPWREGTERVTRYYHGDQDNPLLDDGYKRYLANLQGPLSKAWNKGDWDAFEGKALPDWNETIHICDPFEIPLDWTRWRAMDDGFIAPWCCGFFAKEPFTGRIYLYQELYETLLSPSEQVQRIKDNTQPEERFTFNFADPAMWATDRKDQLGRITSIANEYSKSGLTLTRADNHRINGKRKLHNMLGLLPDGRPGLIVFRWCHNVIRTFPELPTDPNNIEDVDTKSEDHPYDMVRYGLTNIQIQDRPTPEQQRQRVAVNPMAYSRSL